MKKYWLFTSIFACLLAFSCKKSDTEVAENRDEQGRLLEKITRRRSDFAREGLYQRFNPAGKVVEEGFYKNDKLEGEHKFFYPGGAVEIVEPNVGGLIHGKYRKYRENGSLELEQDYNNGVLEGLSKRWYANGTLMEEVTMRDNEENGPFKEWYENGNLKAEGSYRTPDDPDFEGEKEHGILKLYDTKGQLETIMQCEQGVCKTIWKLENRN